MMKYTEYKHVHDIHVYLLTNQSQVLRFQHNLNFVEKIP